jgi:hypothetical protein
MVEGNAAELLNPVETLIDIKIEPFRDLPASISTTTWQQFITAATPNSITFKMHPGQVPALNKWLVEQGVQVLEIRSRHSLEAYFLSLTNDTATPHRAI